MVIILTIIIGLSLLFSVMLIWLAAPKTPYDQPTLRLTTLLFGSWLVAAAMFGSFFYVFRIPGFFDLTIERLLFGMILFALVIGLFTGRLELRQNLKIEFWMAVFVLICLASMLRFGFTSPNPEAFPNPWFVFINGYLFPFAIFLVGKHFIRFDTDKRIVFGALFLLGLYLALIAPLEYYKLRQFVFPRFINDPDFYLHFDRARGPFMNAAFNGLAMSIGFLCGMHLVGTSDGLKRLVYTAALLLFFPAIFFTQTRSSYLCFIIAFVGVLAWYRAPFPKLKVFALPLALVLALMLSQAPRLLSADRRAGGVFQVAEVNIRFQLIQRSIEILQDNPLFGIGLAQFMPKSLEEYKGRGTVAASADEQTQHNHILGMAVEIGILGAAIYLIIVFQVFKRIYLLWGNTPETGFSGNNFLLIAALIWVVVLNNNLFVEPAYFVFPNAVPFAMAGMVDRLYGEVALV